MRKSLFGTPERYGPLFLYKKWDPYAPDENPHPISCEFTDAKDLKKFIGVNLSGVTFDIATGLEKGLLIEPLSQQYRWRGFMKNHPGDTLWSAYAGVDIGAASSNTLIYAGGIAVSDTATTNTGSQTSVASAYVNNANLVRLNEKWSGWGETAAGAVAAEAGISFIKHVRWRTPSAGVYDIGFSEDGETYIDLSVALAGSITPAFIGPYVQNYSSVATGYRIGFKYFRYYKGNTKMKSGRRVCVYK